MARHHGKPDAALNSVELDLIKAVCAEDQDGKAELALMGKSSPQNNESTHVSRMNTVGSRTQIIRFRNVDASRS